MSKKACCGQSPRHSPDRPQNEGVPCPDNLTLAGYLDSMLGDAERQAVEDHLSRCPACRQAVEELREILGALTGAPADKAVLKPLTDQAKKLVDE